VKANEIIGVFVAAAAMRNREIGKKRHYLGGRKGPRKYEKGMRQDLEFRKLTI
jgi:hypothetical protein